MIGVTSAKPLLAVTVRKGSSACHTFGPRPVVLLLATFTMNGSAEFSTNFQIPRAILRIVASAKGRFTPNFLPSSFERKIEGQGIDQSMHSAAVRQGFSAPAFTSTLRG